MNEDVLNFLNRNNINVNELRKTTDTHIYSPGEINKIVDVCGFTNRPVNKEVSIADIIGYENDFPDLFASLDYYFDRSMGEYQRRSIGLLNYQSHEIINALKESFINEPMIAEEIDGKYVITDNGFHRYTVLRALFLANKIEYKIPLRVYEVNYDKTYAKFLLEHAVGGYRVEADIDKNYHLTGNVRVSKDGRYGIFDDEALTNFTKAVLNETMQINNKLIDVYSQRYPSFKEYLVNNEIINKESGLVK